MAKHVKPRSAAGGVWIILGLLLLAIAIAVLATAIGASAVAQVFSPLSTGL